MHSAHDFLVALSIVLGIAAVTTVVFQRLHQPVVLGYLLAGLLVGPHVPFPLVADAGIVETLSELGVILLMFSLGLEFSFRKLIQLGPTAGLTAVIQSTLMLWLGFVVGRALGWSTLEALFTGAIIAISSTTIIAKAFDEQNIRGRLREFVVGVLIVEDLIAILLMALLTAVATGSGLSAGHLALTTGRLVAFLAVLIAAGLLVVPRAMRFVVRLGRKETTLVASIGLCFGIALLAQSFGYSVALGAFLAGSLVAESGRAAEVERLVEPVRDIFAAIFFVAVGMLIDPALVSRHWPAIAALAATVIVGKIVGVSLGAFLTGRSTRTSLQAGMSLAQIGEFSFIIAGLGLSLKATGDFLYPVAVSVSAVTTLSTPWLIRVAGPAANWVDRKLPPSLQTFAALYGSWVERLGGSGSKPSGALRKPTGLLMMDAVLLAGVTVSTAVFIDDLGAWLAAAAGFGALASQWLVLGGAFALALPFCIGIVRTSRRLGAILAERAFPQAAAGKTDLADAPRRALLITLQVGCVLAVGIPVMAVTQPFLSGVHGALLLLLLLAGLGVGFWRSTANLQGHLRAGAQVIVAALAAQTRESPNEDVLAPVQQLLPGLGEPVTVRLDARSTVIGKTLAQLNLRGVTGATVLAIQRGQRGVLVPTAQEVLQAGDVLALAGTHEAIAAAKSLLR